MSGFTKAQAVEARGLRILLPFLEEQSHEGRYVLTSKGRLAKHLQETVGDALFNSDVETIHSVEFKIEEKHTGNLFIETWSNRNFDDKRDHAEYGPNPGWAHKLKADLLFYYFLDNDALYIINLFRLQQWAFGHHDVPGNIYRYREVPQGKYAQRNDTHGRLVPVVDLQKGLDPGAIRRTFPKQIEMFDGDAAA
jgi:hypothetical protein